MSSGIGWQIPRLPGLGDADWTEIFSNLYRVGYDRDCIIEHEDRRFEGTDELVKRGFLLARNILRPHIPKGYRGSDDRPSATAALFDRLTYRDVAKTIDHSLLRPELDDAFIDDNIRLAAEYDVASSARSVARVAEMLRGSDVKVGTVVGFPHGNVLTETKVFETRRALEQGAREIDMVLNIGALKRRDTDVGTTSGRWWTSPMLAARS